MNISKYDFKYTGIMKDAMQSVPIGNGDLGANIWADKNGLSLLLSKTDAWSELHRLLKTGLINLKITPNPFNRKTKWHLSYEDGILYVRAKDVCLEIYADANAPAYHLHFSSETPRTAELHIINYRDKEMHISSLDHSNYHMYGEKHAKNPSRLALLFSRNKFENTEDNPLGYKCVEAADVIFSKTKHSIGQYHHNDTSCYEFTLEYQGLKDFSEKSDPLLNRTFGFLAFSKELEKYGNSLKGDNLTEFDISVASHTDFYENGEDWVDAAYKLADSIKTDKSAHKSYWANIWKKSWVEIDGDKDSYRLTETYIAQRYLTVCAGRGASPIKFNGSIFTNEPSPFVKKQINYDYRRWGGPYWFQNTRLVYWGMLYLGDYDLIKPFFKMYLDSLPLAKYRTKEYFGHDGAFYPETMTMFATYTNKDYGLEREGKAKSYIPNPYIRYYFVGALELCQMMFAYVEHTLDYDFLKKDVLPFAKEILTFYREHFDVKNGKLYFYPSASLETWQDCADDTPTIVGIMSIADEILRCDGVSSDLIELCKDLKSLLPEIPTCQKHGKSVIAPFRTNMDEVRRNVENPELYSVFPFPIYGLGKDELNLARNTYAERDIKESGGWQQHGIQAARLGLSEEAEKELIHNSLNTNKKCIFPAFWGPNYDWLPDQDNGANLIMTLTNMLVQADCDAIRVLPAWNKNKDVKFRLPVGANNFIEVEFINGKLERYELDYPTEQKIIF